MNFPRIIAATASPRRHAVLRSLGVGFDIVAPDVEEIHDASDPVRTVSHNARAKFAAARRLCHGRPVLGADTLVYFRGRLIGKPRDVEEARAFLRGFSGAVQLVFTAVAMGAADEDEPRVRVEASSVRFKVLDEDEINSYVDEVRPLDRAGAYDIDASGDRLIAGFEGSYTNIMGLPREVVEPWLRSLGEKQCGK